MTRKPARERSFRKTKSESKSLTTKIEANRKLNFYQRSIGIVLVSSAIFGIYLLATDKSLWLLAVSHAYGLLVISIIDALLGLFNLLLPFRKSIPLSYGWALLTILLQLGDIATAPQYKMTVQYFAGYLLGLWAYDAILVAQVAVIVIGLYMRRFEKLLVRKKQLTYFDLGLKKGRRDFFQIMGSIAGLVILASILGAFETFNPPNSETTGSTQTSTLPSGAIANKNDLQIGVPIYFDYPSSGYTNMLLKKSDGSLIALSILCTHVCCQCQYDSVSTQLSCPCHGSIFDQAGNVLRGPAATNLPNVELSVDDGGNIFPVRVLGTSPCLF